MCDKEAAGRESPPLWGTKLDTHHPTPPKWGDNVGHLSSLQAYENIHMNSPTGKASGILQWFRSLTKGPQTLPDAAPADVAATQPTLPASPQEQPAGNFYLFQFFIVITLDGVEYVGIPKQAIRDTGKSPPTVVWGTRIDRCLPKEDKDKVRWIDDLTNGLVRRPRRSPEDWLGAEGSLGDDMKLVIDGILQTGKNEVLFSLFNPQRRIRIAYGFSLKIFASKFS